MVGIVSAAGLVGFLSEPDTALQIFALKRANDNIGLLWTEFAGVVGQIEALYENESFPERELAALVVAKIYYHLQEYDESMIFALRAGKLFDIEQEGEFQDTIIAKCIDTFIAHSSQSTSSDDSPDKLDNAGNTVNGSASTSAGFSAPVTPFSQSTLPSKSFLSREESNVDPPQPQAQPTDPDAPAPTLTPLPKGTQKHLSAVITRIFERCFEQGAYRQVVGIAVEARNLAILRETITKASESGTGGDKSAKFRARDRPGKRDEIMDYLLAICLNVIQERTLRNQILQLILDMLLENQVASPDYFAIARCMVYLGKHAMAANILQHLVEQQNPKAIAIAYQLSFDLYDNGSQEFRTKVTDHLPSIGDDESEFNSSNGHPVEPNSASNQDTTHESDPLLSDIQENTGSAPATSTVVSRTKPVNLTAEHKKAYQSIREILQGTKSIELGLEFLFRSNKTDRNILKQLKNSLEARNSIFHSAVTFANAFMNAGTTNDWFIRENLDWLAKAINWSKFSVTASLGVIHRGNIGQGQKLLEPYLRESGTSGSGSPYSRGGALYALGLIYANHGKHVLDYLHNQLKNATTDEVIVHGACLGLGVAGMATESEEVVEELKRALFSDMTVSGQAAGLAIGLVMLGSGDKQALETMIAYAHETDHDKTVRGLALGMALIAYARQEAADGLIDDLLDDPDPTVRYGGIWTIALAYCGTSSNKAVRKLLHVAVSDVNDDVRRTAVMSLGFVLFRKPGSVPRMVELLAESYNPHVRYGATMALGIACAGTGLEEAVDLLEPMMKDTTDFVRQGSFIALAMIVVQQSEAMNPKVVTIRRHFQKVISDRHEDAMAKFGAALALGIIDAGGRNCTISLQTQTGNLNMAAVVGMAIFTQYWYWFPLTHFISLTFTPTTVIGVDQDLDVPNLKMHCAARPSMFEYPPTMEVKTEEAPEKVKTAVLSTTAQARRRKREKERQQKDPMEVDPSPTTPKPSTGVDDDKMDTDPVPGKGADDKTVVEGKDKDQEVRPSSSRGNTKSKVEKEKIGFEVDNVSRVLPSQLKYLSFPSEGRYTPVKKPTGGVVLLSDNQPDEPKSLIERQVKKTAPRAAPDSTMNTTGAAQTGASTATATATAIPTQAQPATPVPSDTAAAVLTAVDEDEEGVEEAQVPEEFDYYSDGEDGDAEMDEAEAGE